MTERVSAVSASVVETRNRSFLCTETMTAIRHPTSSTLKCLNFEFMKTVTELISSGETSTAEFVQKARVHIFQYASLDDLVHSGINLCILLQTMLDGAAISGGERYTACAILACGDENDPRQKLKDLADDWVAFLLWPCKSKLSAGS